MNINLVINQTMQDQQLTLREFAAELRISHPTVINWRDGKSAPGGDFLIDAVIRWRDWRRSFAVNCLMARWPEAAAAWEVLANGSKIRA